VKSINKHTFVIIGGATRAGTTSLYKYLSDHPDVCASSQKETRFFLDEEYPSPYPITFRHDRNPIEKYFEYFLDIERRIYLEATPDYLYSSGTPNRVKAYLGNVKWIFILREPIERLESWFHFGRQMGELAADIGLDEYITMQLSYSSPHPKQIFNSLQQGRYSHYLQPFYDIFGCENVRLFSFSALEREPLELMKNVSRFIGIDDNFYVNYKFLPFNASIPIKDVGRLEKLYRAHAVQLYLRVYNKPLIRKFMHFFRLYLADPLYYRFRAEKAGREQISTELRERLEEYYAEELGRLGKFSENKFSW